MQEQAMKGHGFGLPGIELDLRELASRHCEPAVDTGLALLDFAAVQAAEKILGVIARRDFAQHGPGEGLDGVAAEEFAPIMIEEFAGGEYVAPGDFAAVGDDHADDALTLQARCGAREALLNFLDEAVDRTTNSLRLLDF